MSCMMMDAVMYGDTPIIMIERVEKPPPEKMFKRPRNWLVARYVESAAASMPGIGMAARRRKTMSAPRTKSTRLRSVSSSMMRRVFRTNNSHIGLCYRTAGFLNEGTRRRRDRDTLNGELLRDISAADDLCEAELS